MINTILLALILVILLIIGVTVLAIALLYFIANEETLNKALEVRKEKRQ